MRKQSRGAGVGRPAETKLQTGRACWQHRQDQHGTTTGIRLVVFTTPAAEGQLVGPVQPQE